MNRMLQHLSRVRPYLAPARWYICNDSCAGHVVEKFNARRFAAKRLTAVAGPFSTWQDANWAMQEYYKKAGNRPHTPTAVSIDALYQDIGGEG